MTTAQVILSWNAQRNVIGKIMKQYRKNEYIYVEI